MNKERFTFEEIKKNATSSGWVLPHDSPGCVNKFVLRGKDKNGEFKNYRAYAALEEEVFVVEKKDPEYSKDLPLIRGSEYERLFDHLDFNVHHTAQPRFYTGVPIDEEKKRKKEFQALYSLFEAVNKDDGLYELLYEL